jgi:hypothetical protein
MFSLFSRKAHKDLSLIVDIQSGVVRASLVSLNTNEVPHIICIFSRLLPHKTEVDGTYLTTVMLKALEEVALKISTDGFARAAEVGYEGHSLQSIHYVMSSPWLVSQSKTVKISYEKETEVTEASIHALVEKERDVLMNKFHEGSLNSEFEKDLTLIEQKIFDVRLNGYSVQDYRGKKARNFETSFAVTTSSKYILSKIEETVGKILRCKKQEFHSALLLQYTALRTIVGNRDEYISLHVHSELTDIVVVKRGISSYLASFPFGTAEVLRRLSTALGTSESSGVSLLALHESGKLEESEHHRVDALISPILTDWQTQLLSMLGMIGEKTILPRLVYLSAHSNAELFKMILIETKFEVLPFDYTLVEKAVVFEKSSEKSSFIGIYAVALNDMI